MSAQLDLSAQIYWCPVCGPSLRCLTDEDDEAEHYVTIHYNRPHPWNLDIDEDARPQ